MSIASLGVSASTSSANGQCPFNCAWITFELGWLANRHARPDKVGKKEQVVRSKEQKKVATLEATAKGKMSAGSYPF